MGTHIEEVQAEGHLVDSGIVSKMFDSIIKNDGQFKVTEFRMGRTNLEPSVMKIQIITTTKEKLNFIIKELHNIGCVPLETKNARLNPSEKDGTVPDDFYSTTNQKTYVKLKDEWKLVKNARMDSVIVIRDNLPAATLMRDVKKEDMIVCGLNGIKVVPEFKERDRGVFEFMNNEVSSERRVETAVKHLAVMMKQVKKNNGKIAVVAGPVVVHTGGVNGLSKLIREGYVDILLSGNALAVHDIENAFYGTSLGVNVGTGIPEEHGHRNHMSAINIIRRAGGVKDAVNKRLLKTGIMYECIKRNIPFVLAGSLRDDGPLPEVIMDMYEAQKAYKDSLRGVNMAIMLSSMLHSIATGNMLPAYVKTVCVDINPAVVTKLADRGSHQTIGIVTDVGLFLDLLAKEF